MSGAEVFYSVDIVRASAGTGKTYSLTQRLIQILAKGEKPERLLATTFTRKAAGEIKNRLFSRLAEDSLSGDPAAAKQSLELLRQLTNSQHQLKISTLDSFFLAVVRAFAFELGLPPNWRLIEDEEEERIRQASIGALLAKNSSKYLSLLLQLLSNGNYSRSVHERMLSSIAALHDVFRKSEPAPWYWFEAPAPLAPEALQAAISQLERAELPKKKNGEPLASYTNAVSKALDAARHGLWEDFIAQGIAKSLLSGSTRFDGKEIPPELTRSVRVLIKQAQAVLLRKLENRTRSTAALIGAYTEVFDKRKLTHRVINFADLTYLLRCRIASNDQQEFYYRLDAELPHILLDEFQDTSAEQWNVLEPLVAEIAAKAGAEHSFFCVGDVKQAIYGWRGGVSEIFDGLLGRFPQFETTLRSLDKSYRSSQTVIDLVNLVFGSLSDNPALEGSDGAYREAAQSWSKDFCLHQTQRTDLAGFAALREVSSGTDNMRDSIPQRTAELIKDLVHRAPGAGIGVLVRTNRSIPNILLALRHPDIGIFASQEGGNPLTDSPAVRTVLALFRLADHPGDSAAAFLIESSPLHSIFGTDSTGGLRSRIADQGFGKTVNEIAACAAAHASHMDALRLRRLVELAYMYDSRATGRMDDFVRFVETKKVEDPRAAQVRVMTIHKAKGLEFDIVVLPELDAPLCGSSRPPLLVSGDNPLTSPNRVVCYPKKELRQLSPQLQEIYRTCLVEEIKEEFSVLYVALTRARHAVYMLSADTKKNGVSFSSILRAAAPKQQMPHAQEIVFEIGDRLWHRQHPEMEKRPVPEDEQLAPAAPTISLPPAPERTRALLRQTPSALEGGTEVRLADRLQLASSAAMTRGIVLHAFFETIQWLEGIVPDPEALRKIAARHGASGAAIAQLVDYFCALLKHPVAIELLAKTSPARAGREHEVFCELPFAVREGDRVLTGTIDRLVIELKDGKPCGAEVIDYKSDRFSGPVEELLQKKTDFYRPQLAAYKRIAARLAGLDITRVTGKLFFLDVHRIVEV